ncbi:hypothetical protein FS749_014951 [Ceratobasidium sp. UAMH 11750]|nr:hypothetical protein FS749_014951 [Ceratobasidium sp. UAMH 11750]
MFSMILCNPATRKVPSCQMFLTHDVEEDQSTIFYPTAITDLPYGNRVKYSEESTTYAQWLLQVVPETDAECAGRSNASVLSESGSPLLVSAAFHQLLTTLKDIKSASSDADVLVHDAAPALDSDIEEDAPSAQKPGREQETIQEAASDIQQFSDSEQEEADTTITLNDTNIQTADELLLVQPSVTVNQKSVSEQSDMFKSPGAPEYESSTLNVEFLEGLDSADLAKAYETAMNALEDIPQNESLEQVTESVLDGQIESLESNPDHNNSAPVPSVASLEDQFLNLDGHPLPLKCPDGWSETMNALNDDMQRVPDNLAEVWAPVVAQWHVFETPQEKGHLRPKSARYNPPALADAQHIGHTKENWVAKVCTTDQSHEIKMFYVALQLMHRKIAMGKNLNYYALTKPSGTEDDWNLIAFGGEFGMVVILKLILYWGLDFHDTMQSMSDWMKVVTDLVSVLKCMTEYIGWKFKSITKTPAAPLPPSYVTQPVPSGSGTGARVAKHKLTQSSPSKPKLSGDLGAVAASTSQQPQKAPSKHRKSTMVAKAADVDQPSAADVSIASTSASAESGLRRSSRAPKPQQRSS